VHGVAVLALRAAHVLLQGAAEGDVDDLHAPADRQQRQPEVQRLPGDRQVEGVLDVVHVVDTGVGVRGAVAVRGDVAAAGEQDTVEAGEPGGDVRIGLVGRVDGRRFAAGPPDGLDERTGVDLGGEAQGGGGGGETGRDGDQWSHSWIQVVLSSVYFSRACADLSRPLPDCFIPPKGTVRSPSS
jgi:hypothetical protein